MPSKSRWINWIWGVKSEFRLTNIKPVNFNPLPVCQSTEVDNWGLNCESSCWSFLHSHFLPLQCLTVRVGLDRGFNDTSMGSSSWTVKKQLEYYIIFKKAPPIYFFLIGTLYDNASYRWLRLGLFDLRGNSVQITETLGSQATSTIGIFLDQLDGLQGLHHLTGNWSRAATEVRWGNTIVLVTFCFYDLVSSP